MSQLQSIRGTRDLLPKERRRFTFIEQTAAEISELYGFEPIETPILEPAALFLRSLGDTSDIVSKQMYKFKDLGGDDIVLRPEGTAGVARAFISEGLAQHLPLKLFYSGPMFRYERPQKGRYRQFYQFGIELLGVESASADIEVVAAGWQLIQKLKLSGNTKLLINTLGDQESRDIYRDRLVSYLNLYKEKLSPDSLVRLEKNPLRILDSKEPQDREILKEAPVLSDCLNPKSREFFDQVLAGIKALGIPFEIDQKLVRGLDYYCHTVFEFTTDSLGAQNAILAGGRYDGLIRDLGGPVTPGVGWASGIDRLAELLPEEPPRLATTALIPLGPEAETEALMLANQLRNEGFKIELGYSGNLAKRLKRADKIGSSLAVIFGSDELKADLYQVKVLKTGEQVKVARSELAGWIKKHLSGS
jgi:histidyl-tRNA synthetase